MSTHDQNSGEKSLDVDGIEVRWELGRGTLTVGGYPCTVFFRDSSLTALMNGFLQMVGPRRFSLALQSEGQRGVEQDWQIVAVEPTFEAGFAALARFAHVSGWGRWELVELDRVNRTALFRIHHGWEGEIQRALATTYGSGLVAGKLTGLCQRLFETPCWPRQTMFTAEGDPYDEIVVEASERTLDDELRGLAADEQATSADLHKLLADVKASAGAREAALTERDRMLKDLQDKVEVIEEQRRAIQVLSTPIIQLWDEILAVPIVGAIDSDRTARMMERLLESIIQTKARFAILDVTGVETIDTSTADNFVRIIRAVQLLGAQGVISGIGPLVAQTIVDLGVDLTGIRTFSNLREALRACLAAPRRAPSTSA